MLLPLTLVALLAGGATPLSRGTPQIPSAITVPSSPTRVALPLHLPKECPSQAPACTSGEPALSLAQVRELAKVFKLNVRVTPSSKTSPVTLNLNLQNPTAGVFGIGLPPMYVQKGESYYAASSIFGFLGQANAGAYYTAFPRLEFHTARSTIDLGALPPQKLKLFFAGMTYPFAQALLPETFNPKSPCTHCVVPGIMTMTWSRESPKYFQTDVRPGEVVMLLTYAPRHEADARTPYAASVAIVEPDGKLGVFPSERPTQLVTDPTQLTPTTGNEGNGLLLRMTNTPLDHLTEGIVSSK